MRIFLPLCLCFTVLLACSEDEKPDPVPGNRSDTASTTGTEDTGAEDTGAEDTGAEDTGAEDTTIADSQDPVDVTDTGVEDTGAVADTTDTTDTNDPADDTMDPVDDTAEDVVDPDTAPEEDTSTVDDTGCVPTVTCESEAKNCGTISDGCSGTLDCGQCEVPETCGGAGVENVCGCTAVCDDKACGKKDDCNGTCEEGSGCCTDSCGPIGSTECVDSTSIRTCGNFDNDPCLEWTEPSDCLGGAACENNECGSCTPVCADKECGEDDGCGNPCAEGGSCCVDECQMGQVLCKDGSGVKGCGNYDADVCLDWSMATPCESGTCDGNECAPAPDCKNPVAIISAVGSSGNGVCDADNMLFNDGQAAEFWAGTENSWDQGGIPVSSCKIVDFGTACTPNQICVEAWAGQDGCSGDDCGGGACDTCTGPPLGIHLFTNESNSTFSYEYMATMYGDAMGDPGSLQCLSIPPSSNQTVRYVLVCRNFCPSNNNASSYNVFVDHVYME